MRDILPDYSIRLRTTKSDAAERLLVRLDTVAPLAMMVGVIVLNQWLPEMLFQD